MQYNVVFSEEDFQILSAALVELPFKLVAPLIQKINQQVAEQQKKTTDATRKTTEQSV